MRILGIDPGIGIVGFGFVDVNTESSDAKPTSPTPVQPLLGPEWGAITTSKDKSVASRLLEIHHDLSALLDQVKPDVAVVEQLFFFKNAKTMVPVSQARGVILMTLEMRGIPFYEYTPMQVKQALTGYGKATKQEVQSMVQTVLELEELPRPDDAADALAMTVCHYNTVVRTQILQSR